VPLSINIAQAEDGTSLVEPGAKVKQLVGEIDRYDVLQSSLIPSGLSETMSVGELKDLVAFLESLRESG
jgi:hypothetical protein